MSARMGGRSAPAAAPKEAAAKEEGSDSSDDEDEDGFTKVALPKTGRAAAKKDADAEEKRKARACGGKLWLVLVSILPRIRPELLTRLWA